MASLVLPRDASRQRLRQRERHREQRRTHRECHQRRCDHELILTANVDVIIISRVRQHLVAGHRWTYAEDTLSAESALRRGILSRGLPGTAYLDYADSRTMPTFARSPSSAVVTVVVLSA